MLVLKGRPGKSKILVAIKEEYKDSFIGKNVLKLIKDYLFIRRVLALF